MIRIYAMRYVWDERKNRENQRKHGGISFELAALVFEDPYCLIELDRVDEAGEQRWYALGTVSVRPGIRAVLLVVHAYRHPGDEDLSPGIPREDSYGEEIIRIISARRADKHDFRRYQEQAVD
jgi:uncharacterized DUF497 family protein